MIIFSPSASFVLQGATVLWSSPDQVNNLGDTTGKYRLYASRTNKTTFASLTAEQRHYLGCFSQKNYV